MAHSQQPRILIVDSRASPQQGSTITFDVEEGAINDFPAPQVSYDSFTVTLKPPICGLRGVRLLYANIGNPEDNNVDLYWLLRISEFGISCRTSTASDGATFVIPVNSAQGFRTLHRAESDFEAVALQQPAADIHRLTVDLLLPGGVRPAIQEPWFFVLELRY